MALCSRRLGGGHDWDNRGAALVVANDDVLLAGRNSLRGRDPTFGLLRPGSSAVSLRILTMAKTELCIRLDLPNGNRLGPGKIALLEAIQAKDRLPQRRGI